MRAYCFRSSVVSSSCLLRGQKRASRRRLRRLSCNGSQPASNQIQRAINSQSIQHGLIVSSASTMLIKTNHADHSLLYALAASAPSSPPKSLRLLPSLVHPLPAAWRASWTSTARCVTVFWPVCMLAWPAGRLVPSINLTLLARPIFVQLPKGPASSPNAKSLNPLARYKARYFDGKNASGAPIVHAIIGIFLIGYTVGASLSSRTPEQRHGHALNLADLCILPSLGIRRLPDALETS